MIHSQGQHHYFLKIQTYYLYGVFIALIRVCGFIMNYLSVYYKPAEHAMLTGCFAIYVRIVCLCVYMWLHVNVQVLFCILTECFN